MNRRFSFHITLVTVSPLSLQGREQGEGSSTIVAGTMRPLTSRLRSTTARQAIVSPSTKGEADRIEPTSCPI